MHTLDISPKPCPHCPDLLMTCKTSKSFSHTSGNLGRQCPQPSGYQLRLETLQTQKAGSISEPGQDETPSDEEMEDDNAFGATHNLPEADAFAVDADVDLDSRFLLDMLSIDGPRQLEVSNTGLEDTGATGREGDKVPNWDF